MTWFGMNNPEETEYHREILFPAFTVEAASMSVFDLLSMTLPLPFNHGLLVDYVISGKFTGVQVIEAWNAFTGEWETCTSGSKLRSSTGGQTSCL
jgi:hypothetical protein